MPEGDEADLIRRLKRREEAAFNELVLRYEDRVFRLVMRMLGDPEEAEDLAQEVFITVFQSIDGFRGDAKLSTWLYRVASNQCKNRIKYLKRRARDAKQPFDELAHRREVHSSTLGTSAQLPQPDAMAEGRQTESLIQAALASLAQEHRELIVLRDIESLTYDEIQEITGLAQGTVKSRLHRARLALQQEVERLSTPAPGEGGAR
jgi:RNA polymerase sigma-70 factor (ECF subfamily)